MSHFYEVNGQAITERFLFSLLAEVISSTSKQHTDEICQIEVEKSEGSPHQKTYYVLP